MIVIGDSIVEGHGCEFHETFSWKLNNKAEDLNWEVTNLGVQGASPSYYAANINRYLSAEPDAVFILLFENDLQDDRFQETSYFQKPIMDNPQKLYIGNNLPPFTPQFIEPFVALFITLERSYLINLVKKSFYMLGERSYRQIIDQNLSIWTINREQDRISALAPWLVAPSMMDTQWAMSQKYLDFVINRLIKDDIPVYVAFLSLGALIPGQAEDYKTHAVMLNKKIDRWTNKRGVPFLSLVPLVENLMKTHEPTDIMIKDDGHPRAETHTIFADIIWEWFMAGTP
ncbi:MAG: SGNH/GDSL hydrolase family protein [Desulfamplus sp.]|nr:SGNH/GDSL hydrolase family protein [Desulfamplus sp.]